MRPIQEELVALVDHCVRTRTHLIAHAPTGLGKTAATLAPALSYVLDKDLAVVFVTSRHTQHLIALKTAREMKQMHHLSFSALSIVGKRHMCAHQGTAIMRSDDFATYCKGMRESGQCLQFINSRSGATVSMFAKAAVQELEPQGPLSAERFVDLGIEKAMCPYELALYAAERAKLIVTDYHYLFSEPIRNKFLGRINKKPEQLIVIVDEGHNLPGRVRESLTYRLTTTALRRAVQEARDFHLDDILPILTAMESTLVKMGAAMEQEEVLVTHEDWEKVLEPFGGLERCSAIFENAIEVVHESNKKYSNIASVEKFTSAWHAGTQDSFARILTRVPQGWVLSLRCLDPSIATRQFIKDTHCTIMMSGTLTPTAMFAQQLGFPESTIEKEFGSPFPQSNRLCVIQTGLTTKFSKRDDAQYEKFAAACAETVNAIPGCSAIYFPSYAVLDYVQRHFEPLCKKTIFREDPSMTKEERAEFLERFKAYAASGAVLLGVASGSFGEGIDLPGILKAVLVVGIPLDRPNLETKQLINYYDRLCGKGWEYGYTLPALMRTMQNAGRCIRSETDRGVLVFMDERYIWPSYKKCFPSDWEIKVAAKPLPLIQKFFS
jgi:DNA excision repair protein ERCC-2